MGAMLLGRMWRKMMSRVLVPVARAARINSLSLFVTPCLRGETSGFLQWSHDSNQKPAAKARRSRTHEMVDDRAGNHLLPRPPGPGGKSRTMALFREFHNENEYTRGRGDCQWAGRRGLHTRKDLQRVVWQRLDGEPGEDCDVSGLIFLELLTLGSLIFKADLKNWMPAQNRCSMRG